MLRVRAVVRARAHELLVCRAQVVEDDLRLFFGTFGDVQSVKIINDKLTGKSKGYAEPLARRWV